MTRKQRTIEILVRELINYTGKSRGWVIRTLKQSGDYQKILNGEHPRVLDTFLY